MSKPIIGYVLSRVRLWSSQSHLVYLLAVTTEKGGQVYGRDPLTDQVTHISARDVTYRFPEGTTLDHALGAGDRAAKEYVRLTPGIEAAQRELDRLRKARDMAVLDAAKGLEPPKHKSCILCGGVVAQGIWIAPGCQGGDACPR